MELNRCHPVEIFGRKCPCCKIQFNRKARKQTHEQFLGLPHHRQLFLTKNQNYERFCKDLTNLLFIICFNHLTPSTHIPN